MRIERGNSLVLAAALDDTPAWSLGREDASAESALKDIGTLLEGPAKDKGEIVQAPGAPAPNSLGPDDDDANHLMNWLKAMQTRSVPNANIDHGFSHSLVCIMAAQSYREGKKLYWDPRNERIVDHSISQPA